MALVANSYAVANTQFASEWGHRRLFTILAQPGACCVYYCSVVPIETASTTPYSPGALRGGGVGGGTK